MILKQDIKLNKTETDILHYLLETHIQTGDYFGNKDNHYKMCNELLDKLEKQRGKVL